MPKTQKSCHVKVQPRHLLTKGGILRNVVNTLNKRRFPALRQAGSCVEKTVFFEF